MTFFVILRCTQHMQGNVSRDLKMISQKKQRRKSVQNSDPGKILDLVMNLLDEKCGLIQTKINEYVIMLLIVYNFFRKFFYNFFL